MGESTIEIWKEIPGYPQYLASNKGRIFSNRRKPYKVLSPGVSPRGYEHVVLTKDKGNHKCLLVHRLICLTFLGECPYGHEVNHKDGKKLNNHIDNLEYLTSSDNAKHAKEMKLKARGEENGWSKLKNNEVIKIRSLANKGMSASKISHFYRVTPECIQKVIKRETWAHI